MIEVLIPTYNRRESLEKNLKDLISYIKSEAPKTSIFISDNASDDGTEEMVRKIIHSNSDVKVRYCRNEQNIGLEQNAVNCLKNASAEYVLFLGDDDYLVKGYLAYCIEQLGRADKKIGAIMPSKKSITYYDERCVSKIDRTNEYHDQGIETAISISHYASQMSGLVLYKPEEIINSYLSSGYRSIYLFIYFFTCNLLKYPSIMAFQYPVSVMTSNKKDWSYNDIGLFDEVFKAYYPYERLVGKRNLNRMIINFVRIHGWRFGIEVYRPFHSLKKFYFLVKMIDGRGLLKRRLFIQFLKEYFVRMKMSSNLK